MAFKGRLDIPGAGTDGVYTTNGTNSHRWSDQPGGQSFAQ